MLAEEYRYDDESNRETEAYSQERSHRTHGDLSEQQRAGTKRERYRHQDFSDSFIHFDLRPKLFHIEIII